jgi:hypothetical protein
LGGSNSAVVLPQAAHAGWLVINHSEKDILGLVWQAKVSVATTKGTLNCKVPPSAHAVNGFQRLIKARRETLARGYIAIKLLV